MMPLIKKYRSVLLVFFIALVCIALIGFNAPKPNKIPFVVNAPNVPYFRVTISDLTIPIFSRGKVSAYDIREITNEVSGLVRHVSTHFHKGSNVKKNDLCLDPNLFH